MVPPYHHTITVNTRGDVVAAAPSESIVCPPTGVRKTSDMVALPSGQFLGTLNF